MKLLALHATALMLAALPLGSAPALAQGSAAQRIEVTGTRLDVRTLCPAVEDDLSRQLARRLTALSARALVHMAFHLDGRTIDAIETSGGTYHDRQAMRQAVQQIDCDNAGAGRERVRFDISYRWDAR